MTSRFVADWPSTIGDRLWIILNFSFLGICQNDSLRTHTQMKAVDELKK